MDKNKKRGIGCLLIIFGMIANFVALAAFTSTTPISRAHDLLAGACFFGWWIPLLVGIVIMYKNRDSVN
jgi:multidrug transporter EmrE-like cation transporter